MTFLSPKTRTKQWKPRLYTLQKCLSFSKYFGSVICFDGQKDWPIGCDVTTTNVKMKLDTKTKLDTESRTTCYLCTLQPSAEESSSIVRK